MSLTFCVIWSEYDCDLLEINCTSFIVKQNVPSVLQISMLQEISYTDVHMKYIYQLQWYVLSSSLQLAVYQQEAEISFCMYEQQKLSLYEYYVETAHCLRHIWYIICTLLLMISVSNLFLLFSSVVSRISCGSWFLLVKLEVHSWTLYSILCTL